MKKTTVFLCLALALQLCACSGKSETKGEYIPPDSDSGSQDSLDSQTDSSSLISDSDDTESNSSDEEETTEVYDTSAISDAYLSDDSSSLSEFDLEIYNKAVEVIGECITDDMNDYQKELAIHDYIVYNCTYDDDALEAIPNPDENSINPYGALIDGEAVCMGYTTSFKMFMDMLEIPCGIVHSTDDEGDEHAWNTVQIEDNWYYVDVTWDDPVPDYDGRPVTHTYFNISKDEISERHILPDDCPDTDSTEYSFVEQSLTGVSDLSELEGLVKTAAENKTDSIVVQFYEGMNVQIEKSEYDDGYELTDDDVIDSALEAGEKQGYTTMFYEVHVLSDGSFAVEISYGNSYS